MASSSNADNSKEIQQYPYPSHVNTANFVSVKLSGQTNYRSWQEQMRCLLESLGMLGFIDGSIKSNKGNWEWKRSDTLVKGWIFGSLTEDVMDTVVGQHTSLLGLGLSLNLNLGLNTSHQVWKHLKDNYDIVAAAPKSISSTVNDKVSSKYYRSRSTYRELHYSIIGDRWEEAHEYFIKDRDALTAKITHEDASPLHIAIDEGSTRCIENILKELTPESLATLVCEKKQNPLHRAALFGNTKAAKMLVDKNPNLLFLSDMEPLLPIHRAMFGADHANTFNYLVEVTLRHIKLSEKEGHDDPFQGLHAAALIKRTIRNELFEVAYELIKKYPEMATAKGFYNLLRSIAGNLDAYLSGTKYNLYQKFVYHCVPITDHNLDNAHKVDLHKIDQDIENQVPNTTTAIAKGRRSCFYSVIRWIYVKLWEVLLLHVAHVKRLHEDKVKHKKTLLLLKRICKEQHKAGHTIAGYTDNRKHFQEAVLFALENDTPEAIEMIFQFFPCEIANIKQNGLNLIQLSIVNRCENVYRVLVDDNSGHVRLKGITSLPKILDEDGNNFLHLAGQLAPIHRLNRVSGAALQMQRELQWFEETKKLSLAKESKKKNKKQETPIMVFRREHKELRKEGEEWMKTTANSYTITAALIITIVFAAAITVPGGNDDNGKANYATKPGFIVFVVSDAISLFTATTSLLLCLSILTTRYRDEDFLYRLPMRLMLGLGMLFISVSSMTIAFSATLYIMFGHGKAWILFLIAALTCLPIISFVTLQLPLLFDLYTSTCGQGVFGKQSDDGKTKLQ